MQDILNDVDLLSDLFTHDAKYLQTLFGEKWRSFAYSLPII